MRPMIPLDVQAMTDFVTYSNVSVVTAILPQYIAKSAIEKVCIYSQPVTRAVTYIADASTRSDAVVGGHPHAYRKR